MPEYQVLARKYRPQRFNEVVGQDAIITTLKNAIQSNRLAHGYLFCGARGTGKTTLARIFAKALNCQQPTSDFEPCNQCASCREITSGNSLDVLEIDGASHRGIDDVRQINETVGYATSSGKYKIYIIDEVHMLTKEAFNALLKTLEEPPAKVKFFFATTEPHKVLPTILSRCQRFNLNRIAIEDIVKKLREIADDLRLNVEEEALHILASRADGGLRDAESLFDQMIAFEKGTITAASVAAVFGMMSRESFFAIDRAGKEGNLTLAFEIAHQVFTEGKDIGYFIDSLLDHYRTILMVKLAGKTATFLSLSDAEREQYEASAKMYTQEQCSAILDLLIQAQGQKMALLGRIALEALLLRILRIRQRIPIELLVRRLVELEQRVSDDLPKQRPIDPPQMQPQEIKKESAIPTKETIKSPNGAKESSSREGGPGKDEAPLGKESIPIETGARPTEETRIADIKQQNRYETLMRFAAVELEGTLIKEF